MKIINLRTVLILLALALALSTSACGSRVYPKTPDGKLIPSQSN